MSTTAIKRKLILGELISQNNHVESNAVNVLEYVKTHPNGRVIALDIDRTSALGNDTNDILQIVSMMTNNFTNQKNDVNALLQLLMNPQVCIATQKIREELKCEPYVVFYTSKGGIVHECTQDEAIAKITARAGLYRNKDTLAFRSGDLAEGYEYLYRQLVKSTCENAQATLMRYTHIYQHLCRVGILTWAISKFLGLGYAAPVYITRGKKDLEIISKHLVVDMSKIFLFDDISDHHLHELGTKSKEQQEHMIKTQPYDFETMERRRELFELLSHCFPITNEFIRENQHLLDLASSSHHQHSIDPDRRDWGLFHLSYFSDVTIEPWCLRNVLATNSKLLKTTQVY